MTALAQPLAGIDNKRWTGVFFCKRITVASTGGPDGLLISHVSANTNSSLGFGSLTVT
jgi:hypothetical protein